MSLEPDITEILDDPDVGGGQPFCVLRETVRVGFVLAEGAKEGTYTINASGNIQPAQPDDLQQLPESDRKNKVLVIRSVFHFQLGEDNGNSTETKPDIVVFGGKQYKLLRCDDWSNWGFCIAYVTEMGKSA